MTWLLLGALVILVIGLAWIAWQKSTTQWRQIEGLVGQIASGEKPRTFLVEGGAGSKKVGLALEKIYARQEELERQIAGRESDRQTILRAMQDGLLAVDSARRVTLVNRAFRKLFDLPRIEPGTPLLDVVRDPTLDRLISETLRAGHAMQSESSLPDTRGEHHVEISAVPIRDDVDLNTTGVVILFHDITQLRQADQVRRDFVANVSHELRTPLSILRGYIETLMDNPKTPREELVRFLEVMERHSKRLGLLVEDLLTLAELESTKPDLQLGDVRLTEVLDNVVRDWEKKLADKRLKAVVEIAPDLSETIRADETRLQEILFNLLDNAVKYSRENGEIRLRGGQRDNQVVLSISDNGIGIPKEDLPRIFERFYRADKARSRELGGTGLGLAIVKHIAQLHGGRVEAESELGKGTTIRVILPIRS